MVGEGLRRRLVPARTVVTKVGLQFTGMRPARALVLCNWNGQTSDPLHTRRRLSVSDPLREIEELERDPSTQDVMLREAITFQVELEARFGFASARILAGVQPQEKR